MAYEEIRYANFRKYGIVFADAHSGGQRIYFADSETALKFRLRYL